MKHLTFCFDALKLMLSLSFMFSCSSIEQAEMKVPKERNIPTAILLSKSTAHVKTEDLVPLYVFKGKDNCDFLGQEDATSTKYHVTLNNQNKESAFRFINNAYLNCLEIEFKYDRNQRNRIYPFL